MAAVTFLVCVLLARNLLLLRKSAATAKVNRLWGRCLLWAAGVELTVEGGEVPDDGPFVIVANHSSMLDIVAGFTVLPVDFRYASRPSFFKIPLFGWAMRLGGHLPLDPENPRQSVRALASLGARFEQGQSILLFPEGTRSQDGTIRTYKRGPFLAAIRNGVPILPVRFWRLHEALPRDSLVPRPIRAAVRIGRPIPTRELGAADARALAEKVERWARFLEPPTR